MIKFFESDTCISKQLVEYFGESFEIGQCGHCSFCKSGKTTLRDTTQLKLLSQFEYNEITHEFIQSIGEGFSDVNLTKFLCGIHTPAFSKQKIKKLQYYGILENYSFLEVKDWVAAESGSHSLAASF